MFGVQKQQLRYLTKNEFVALRQLTRLSKNLYNAALYQIRQHYFQTKEYLNYNQNYHEMKTNENYALLGSACGQQTLKKSR